MKTLISKLEREITLLSNKKTFRHCSWYKKYHLDVVYQLTDEFSELYGITFNHYMKAAVWMHDYGKICSVDRKYDQYMCFMEEIGFSNNQIDIIIDMVIEIDKKDRLETSSLPIKIISSADGVSHLRTPFFMFYWWENSLVDIEDILKENRRKLEVDWSKKIVLPEVRKKYEYLYNSLMVQFSI
jgi:hypothetical protein